MSVRGNQILLFLAAACGAAGLLLTVGSVRATPAAIRQLERRAGDYRQLLGLAAEGERGRAVLRARAAMGRDRAVPVEDVLRSAFPGAEAQVRPRGSQALADGWSVRSVEVAIDDAPLAGIGKLAGEGAALRPPWRVAEVSIAASGRPGYGRVTLVLEAIERSGSGS